MSVNMSSDPSVGINAPNIADALRCQLSQDKRNMQLLENASGTGEYARYLAPLFPNIMYQPSDNDPDNLFRSKFHTQNCTTNNVLEPVLLNVTVHPKQWTTKFKPGSFGYMLVINMVHIAPFDAAVGLFQAAEYLLKPHGKLFIFGSCVMHGILTAYGNAMCDESFKIRSPECVSRDIKDFACLAKENSLKLTHKHHMSGKNKIVTWTKL